MRKLSLALIVGYVFTYSQNEMVAAIAPAAPIAMAHVPAQVGTAISKTVHYAETPVVTGYTSTVYKPDMSVIDMPFKFDHHQRYLRPVRTLVPKVMVPAAVSMPLEPKLPVDVSAVAAAAVAAAGRDVEMHSQPAILPEIRIANPAVYFPPLMTPLIR